MVTSAHILLVGEPDDIRAMLVELLVGEGYLVAAFDSGDEAISYAVKNAQPAVLFFGGFAPFSVVRARREAELGHVRVILATGNYDVPRFAGVDVLKKPFTIERLFAVVAGAA